jgi:helicase
MPDVIDTREGEVTLPCYLPLTTFGRKMQLDDYIRPYVPRLAQGVITRAPDLEEARMDDVRWEMKVPLFLKAGGNLLLEEQVEVVEKRGLGYLEVNSSEDRNGFLSGLGSQNERRLHPRGVIGLQEEVAEVAFTLGFPIPASTSEEEARRRQRLTVENARWTLENCRRGDLPIFAELQGWDLASYRECAEVLSEEEFDGFSVGEHATAGTEELSLEDVIEVVEEEVGDRPIHVSEIGSTKRPDKIEDVGGSSIGSDSYAMAAHEGVVWGREQEIKSPSHESKMRSAVWNLAIGTGQPLPISAINLSAHQRQEAGER